MDKTDLFSAGFHDWPDLMRQPVKPMIGGGDGVVVAVGRR